MTDDILDRVARYRPVSLDEWDATARAEVRALVLDPAGKVQAFGRPRRRWAAAAPLAASAAVAAAVFGGVVIARGSGGTPAPLTGGDGTHFSAESLSDKSPVGPDQYAYRAVHYYQRTSDGRLVDGSADQSLTTQDWVSPNGGGWSLRTRPGSCEFFPAPPPATFTGPTEAFFASLPTDPQQLRSYLLSHVSGSSSLDEAVFVAVGDALRTDDQLASPRLRAAFIDVLSMSSVITVHDDVTDDAGHPAIRVDFSDQARRAGELNSLYFDPTDFHLLEERDGTNGQPSDAPSTLAYSATATPAAPTSDHLSGPADVYLATADGVVDSLPDLAGCAAPLTPGKFAPPVTDSAGNVTVSVTKQPRLVPSR